MLEGSWRIRHPEGTRGQGELLVVRHIDLVEGRREEGGGGRVWRMKNEREMGSEDVRIIRKQRIGAEKSARLTGPTPPSKQDMT